MKQCARKSRVGYETFYEYKITQLNDPSTPGLQPADKLFWGKDNLDSEQNVSRMTSQEEVSPKASAGVGCL